MFRDDSWVFSTRSIKRGSARLSALPRAKRQNRRPGRLHANATRYDLVDYISRNRIAGLLVLHGGEIRLEHYEFGNDARTRWISMSMAKSISTTLVGAAIQDGLIGSVDDPLTRYLPQLKHGGYDGVSIRHLLQMTSGVRWDDTHTDPKSERRVMLDLQIAAAAGSRFMNFLSGQPRVAEPGTIWNYSTGETHVVGALVRAAVGRWCADYLSEKLWSTRSAWSRCHVVARSRRRAWKLRAAASTPRCATTRASVSSC